MYALEYFLIALGLIAAIFAIWFIVDNIPAPTDRIQIINADYQTVFDAIVQLLNQKGYPIVAMDKTAGLINTDFNRELDLLCRAMYPASQDWTKDRLNILLIKRGERLTEVRIVIVQGLCRGYVFKKDYRQWFEEIRRAVTQHRRSSKSLQSVIPCVTLT